jgi:hypothetical protein
MLAARGRDVALAWFTANEDVGQTFVAFSSDAGRTFGAPVRLSEGLTIGRVDLVMLSDGSVVATSLDFTLFGPQLLARRIERSGATSEAVTIAAMEGSRASGVPRVALHGNELVFAWVASGDGGLQVRTAVANLPSPSTRK